MCGTISDRMFTLPTPDPRLPLPIFCDLRLTWSDMLWQIGGVFNDAAENLRVIVD